VIFDVLTESVLEFFREVEDVGVDGVRLMIAVVSAVPVDVGLQYDQSQGECDGVAAERQQQETRVAPRVCLVGDASAGVNGGGFVEQDLVVHVYLRLLHTVTAIQQFHGSARSGEGVGPEFACVNSVPSPPLVFPKPIWHGESALEAYGQWRRYVPRLTIDGDVAIHFLEQRGRGSVFG
jgi:hypothetical protein